MRNLNLITQHGKIFCGNSSNSGKIFTLQKKIITITAGSTTQNLLQKSTETIGDSASSTSFHTFITTESDNPQE